MKDKVYWTMLHKIWGIKGNKILSSLMTKISAQDLWQISPKTLHREFPEISQEMVDDFLWERTRLDVEQEISKLTKSKVKIISFLDPDYPQRLKNIYSPPPILYLRGKLLETSIKIAIVGSRKASPYGKKIALKLAKDLSNNGIQIISGLARGIDACGHQGALEGKGGTVAVLGSGVDVVYRGRIWQYIKKLVNSDNNGVISEFPLGSFPQKFHFLCEIV